jgi:MFS family permease
VIGGVLAPIEWHLVFLVSVPVSLLGTFWSYYKLHDNGARTPSTIDWTGNFTFAIGLIAILTGIVYGLQPYGGHAMGWTSPFVLSCLIGGVAVLIAFVFIERRVKDPMFQMSLFSSRGFAMGNLATLCLSLARGGLQFILIIWLQGIWLPQHGYDFARTPLWAGIYMIPLTIGFLIAGPVSGRLADRHGARNFATVGLVLTGLSLVGLQAIPINFPYPLFASLLLLVGLSMGLFAAPNSSAVMNSLPANRRGAGGAMLNTFQNSASVLSIGFFFTVITLGLSATLPKSLLTGLTHQGVPLAQATAISHIPAIGSLFSAFLGINPIQQLLGPQVLSLPGVHSQVLLGHSFFPSLIEAPFAHGLHLAFLVAAGLCFLGAVFSWMRGPGLQHHVSPLREEIAEGYSSVGEVAMGEVGVGSEGEFIEALSEDGV